MQYFSHGRTHRAVEPAFAGYLKIEALTHANGRHSSAASRKISGAIGVVFSKSHGLTPMDGDLEPGAVGWRRACPELAVA
jgi:hypothetical protein